MKRMLACLGLAVLLLSLVACAPRVDRSVANSPEELTAEQLIALITPERMLAATGRCEVVAREEYIEEEAGYDADSVLRFVFDGDAILVNQNIDYDNGETCRAYYSTDRNDPIFCMDRNGEITAEALSDYDIQQLVGRSLTGSEYYDCTITSRTESGKSWLFTLEAWGPDELVHEVDFTYDPANNTVTRVEARYYDGTIHYGTITFTLNYTRKLTIDDSLLAQAQAPAAAAPSTAPTAFTFAAKDLDGNLVAYTDFTDAKLIMVNFWEPWCGPCVGEMPDLEKLYQAYRDQGLVILGAFATEGMDEDAADVVAQTGVTYPIIHCDSHLAAYQTDAVPTTIFISASGEVLTGSEPYVGAREYDEWAAIVESYLN